MQDMSRSVSVGHAYLNLDPPPPLTVQSSLLRRLALTMPSLPSLLTIPYTLLGVARLQC